MIIVLNIEMNIKSFILTLMMTFILNKYKIFNAYFYINFL